MGNQENNVNEFEKKLWQALCAMRGKIPLDQDKDILLGLIFLCFAEVSFENARIILQKAEIATGRHLLENPENYAMLNSIYLNDEARWKTIKEADEKSIGKVIDRAMINIAMNNRDLEKAVFMDFRSENIDQPTLKKIVDILSEIDFSAFKKSQDLLGRAYEYCLKQSAINGQGEYYSPKCLVEILVHVTEPDDGCILYEPCAGSGGMIVQSMKYIKSKGGQTMSIYAQESMPNTWRIAKQNMTIRGIKADFSDHPADTLLDDQHKEVKADIILANIPFNLVWDYEKCENDERWIYGVPKGNANFAWIQHMLWHLKENGRIGVIMSNGAGISHVWNDGIIRQGIIEDDLVEGIIAVPNRTFYSTTVSASIWILNKKKKRSGTTLFIDAKSMGAMINKQCRELSRDESDKIMDTFKRYRDGEDIDEAGFAKSVTTEDIKNNNYELTAGIYISVPKSNRNKQQLRDELADDYKQYLQLNEKNTALCRKVNDSMEMFLTW